MCSLAPPCFLMPYFTSLLLRCTSEVKTLLSVDQTNERFSTEDTASACLCECVEVIVQAGFERAIEKVRKETTTEKKTAVMAADLCEWSSHVAADEFGDQAERALTCFKSLVTLEPPPGSSNLNNVLSSLESEAAELIFRTMRSFQLFLSWLVVRAKTANDALVAAASRVADSESLQILVHGLSPSGEFMRDIRADFSSRHGEAKKVVLEAIEKAIVTLGTRPTACSIEEKQVCGQLGEAIFTLNIWYCKLSAGPVVDAMRQITDGVVLPPDRVELLKRKEWAGVLEDYLAEPSLERFLAKLLVAKPDIGQLNLDSASKFTHAFVDVVVGTSETMKWADGMPLSSMAADFGPALSTSLREQTLEPHYDMLKSLSTAFGLLKEFATNATDVFDEMAEEIFGDTAVAFFHAVSEAICPAMTSLWGELEQPLRNATIRSATGFVTALRDDADQRAHLFLPPVNPFTLPYLQELSTVQCNTADKELACSFAKALGDDHKYKAIEICCGVSELQRRACEIVTWTRPSDATEVLPSIFYVCPQGDLCIVFARHRCVAPNRNISCTISALDLLSCLSPLYVYLNTRTHTHTRHVVTNIAKQ